MGGEWVRGREEENLLEIRLVTSVCSQENRNLLVPIVLWQDVGPEMNKPKSWI